MASLNKITYPQRLFLWILGYSVLLISCFVVFQYNREKEFKAEKINTELQAVNRYIISEIEDGNNIADIRIDKFKKFKDLRVSIINREGKITYDNNIDSLPGTNHHNRKEIIDALKNGSGYTIRRHSESVGIYYFYSATLSDNGVIIRTAIPYSESLTTLLSADFQFIWGVILISIVMCVFAYYASRRVGLHIIRLNKFANDIETGTQISNTAPFPNDELGSISNNIVRLYAQLQQANADRALEHKATLHEQYEKERIKKQLTNNINHELKTPVASIRVCIETLLERKNLTEEKKQLFLQRCLNNTDRLQHLLSDISLITRMDDGNSSITKESVDLTKIINNVVEERQIIAESKGIDIKNGINRNIQINGNSSLLEAIFNNLIDNAIAYSGGSEIKIDLVYCDNSKVVVSFADNGIGVPSEHLPRLFERFYRIDKGRSRAIGGTGLGLAIVKNAVLLHNGNISVENLNTGGLLFKITLSTDSEQQIS